MIISKQEVSIMIDNFQLCLRTLLSENKCDIYCTGSNAKIPEIRHTDILSYLRALCNSFFIYKVNRTEIAGMKIFEIGEKYYFEDLGIRNAVIGINTRTDINKLLENVV